MNAQRTEAIVAQFKKEFVQRGDDVVKLVQNTADAKITLMMSIDLARPKADQFPGRRSQGPKLQEGSRLDFPGRFSLPEHRVARTGS